MFMVRIVDDLLNIPNPRHSINADVRAFVDRIARREDKIKAARPRAYGGGSRRRRDVGSPWPGPKVEKARARAYGSRRWPAWELAEAAALSFEGGNASAATASRAACSKDSHPRLKPNRDDQLRAIRLFVEPGETHELKRWKPSPEKVNVRGDDDDATILAALEKLGDQAHLTLNPIDPGTSGFATNGDVERLRWLVLDCDVQGRGEASSTKEEKAESFMVAGSILEYLLAEGLPEDCLPVWVDSGNGWRLHFRINMPADPESDDLVKRAIKAVAARFDSDAVKIDPSLGAAVKCCRLPGSVVAKGPNSPDRPHRTSSIHMDGGDGVLPADFLRKIAGPKPGPTSNPKPGPFGARAMGDDRKAAWAEAGIEKELARLAAAPENTRNILLNEVAFILGTLAGAAPEYEQEIRSRLRATAQGLGLPDREIESTIRSGLEAGKAKPRRFPDTILNLPTVPPPAEVKVDLPADDPDGHGDQPRKVFTNYGLTEVQDEATGKTRNVRVPLSAPEIDALAAGIVGDLVKRVGDRLFIPGPNHQPIYLESASRLFALYDDRADVRWTKQGEAITAERYFERMRMTAPAFDAIETRPHFPTIPRIFYLHRAVPIGGGRVLDRLLDFFKPATTLDRHLVRSMILSWFWGGEAGTRPAFLITGPDGDPEMGRGVGKSKMVMILATELVEGFIDVSNSESMDAIKTRLLSNEAGRKRVVILDNLKSHKFSWSGLEGLLTSTEISGRALYVGEARRPNLLNWAITLNGASLSKDMAQRVVVIKLDRPDFSPSWEDGLRTFIRSNLWGIFADIRDRLAEPSQLDVARSRWASWERHVLGKVPEWAKLQDLILERQRAIDDDDEDRQLVIDHFREELKVRGHDPDGERIFVPSAEAAAWVSTATRTAYPTNKASSFLNGLSISELRKSDRGKARGWIWTGRGFNGKDTSALGTDPRPRGYPRFAAS
jgi:hypothetical protein